MDATCQEKEAEEAEEATRKIEEEQQERQKRKEDKAARKALPPLSHENLFQFGENQFKSMKTNLKFMKITTRILECYY